MSYPSTVCPSNKAERLRGYKIPLQAWHFYLGNVRTGPVFPLLFSFNPATLTAPRQTTLDRHLSPEHHLSAFANIMSAVNRVLSKSLRLPKPYTARSVSLLSAGGASSSPRASGFSPRTLAKATTPTRSAFHTMASLRSAAPVKPSEGVGYDPEIKDIANYIHSYKIDSDLAVRVSQLAATPQLLRR